MLSVRLWALPGVLVDFGILGVTVLCTGFYLGPRQRGVSASLWTVSSPWSPTGVSTSALLGASLLVLQNSVSNRCSNVGSSWCFSSSDAGTQRGSMCRSGSGVAECRCVREKMKRCADCFSKFVLYCWCGFGAGASSASEKVGGWGSFEEQHHCRFHSSASPASSSLSAL